MLPKKKRLSRQEFNRFFSVGKRFHSPSFQVVYAPYETFHASIVVPKKVARLAVGRNKVRRRMYAILRHCMVTEGYRGVFIFVTKPGIEKKSYALLKTEVETMMTTVFKK